MNVRVNLGPRISEKRCFLKPFKIFNWIFQKKRNVVFKTFSDISENKGSFFKTHDENNSTDKKKTYSMTINNQFFQNIECTNV